LLGYFLRGLRDGRRGLPVVSPDSAHTTPTLRKLAGDVYVARERVLAEGLGDTAEADIELARLDGPGAQLTRALQRLTTMEERLDEVLAAPLPTGRRFGEEHLPEELVRSRRQREHTRKVKQARKRVEDERTTVAHLRTRASELEATTRASREMTESIRRVVGHRSRLEATSYLSGALANHKDRPLLSGHLDELMPWARPAPDDQQAIS
jgi:hypothetical protein